MKAVPYRLLGESGLQRLEADLAKAVGRWRGGWLGDPDEAMLAVLPAWELDRKALGLPDEPSLARSLGAEKWVATFAGRRATVALAAALAGPKPGAQRPGTVTPLLQGVLDPCLASLCDEVIARPAGEAAADAVDPSALAGALRKGSGAVAALVEIGGERLGMVLGRDLVGGMLGAQRAAPRGGLEGRGPSIQNSKVPVHVVAGSAEVSAAALASLAPGDVILLDAALDATFGLVNTGGTTVARGYLGACAGRKAFQLTS
jgi:hypothetical protein